MSPVSPRETPLRHRRLDLRPARREGVDHIARYSGDLEPPVRIRLFDPVAPVPQPLSQLGPVDRADRHLALEQPVIDHRPPLPIAALHHVGDDGVRVKLGIEIAGSIMPERRRDHLLVPGAHHRARGGVAQPGLDGVLLNPGEGHANRPVVNIHDALVAADHRHQRHRLRRGQGDVAPRPVMDAAVHLLAPEPTPAGNLAFEHPLERRRLDRPGKPERRSALARPGVRLLVGRIVLRVVPVLFEIAHALRGRGDLADRGYRRGRAPRTDQSIEYRVSMPPTYGLSGRRTRYERRASQPCRSVAAIVVGRGSGCWSKQRKAPITHL